MKPTCCSLLPVRAGWGLAGGQTAPVLISGKNAHRTLFGTPASAQRSSAAHGAQASPAGWNSRNFGFHPLALPRPASGVAVG